MTSGLHRCPWCGDDPLYVAYHDTEWGVPEHDPVKLFEMLTLEGAQAGLSWITILRRREGYRTAFAAFDPVKIAAFDEVDVSRLLNDTGIVRHQGKIRATIGNARAWLKLMELDGGFSEWIWQFVGGEPRINRFDTLSAVPGNTPESDAMSRALKKQGFKFVGSTICYAFMQATGMVNDHLISCHCHPSQAS
ncbi:DNA-3-methyladenine glycosylase I [Nitrogeniibacter aestuarii]|uniref:DNA-3-methyladenine glycosylase I n=1 Tax=Nitrogeniibacter aestuarii TaxID=2815343 RepID=UPI001D1118F8|nr:DNA-3-methyladenine glycosylase I [Nitrogeniibacter aestuarii]